MNRYVCFLCILMLILFSTACGSASNNQGDENSLNIRGTLYYLPLAEDKIYGVILPNNKEADLVYAAPERTKQEMFQINSLSCGPDGNLLFHMRHIIFNTASTPWKETTKIVTYNPTTKEMLDLAIGDSDMRFPVLSPDNSKLAMSGGDSFFVKDLKTGELLHYTKFAEKNRGVGTCSWSPDGKLLALTVAEIGKSVATYFFDTDKKEIVLLPWLKGAAPYFSPNGQRIAYLSADYKELIIADKDGKTEQILKGHLFRRINGWIGEDKVLFTRGVFMYTTRIGIADLRSGKLYDFKVTDANEISGACFKSREAISE